MQPYLLPSLCFEVHPLADEDHSLFDFFLMKTGDEVGAELSKKHGNTLKSVAALRGAAQIIELAIETLKKELPPAPPSVKDLRRTESVAKQSVVSQGRLEGIKNRGKPKSEDDSTVGRM